MLVLSRKLNEVIVIDGGIRITVLSIRGNYVRIGLEAPDDVRILRQEICFDTEAEESRVDPTNAMRSPIGQPEGIGAV